MEPTPPAGTSDGALVLACQRGDSGAFEALYRRYFGPVYDFAARTMKDRDEAADVVQDAFIKAHDKIGQLRNADAFRPWLYSIVRREALNRFRARSRESLTSTLESDEPAGNPLLNAPSGDVAADPVAAAELSDSAALVWEAAASLDADTYTVLDLHVRQGLTSAEIATVLGISKGNAYTKVNRMKERTGAAISTYLLIRKGSKHCSELSRLVAGESIPPVTAKLRRAVDRHTRSCPECAERRRALVAPMSIFAALAAVVPPGGLEDAIWQNVSGAVSGGTGRPRPRRRWLAVALGVVIVLLIGSVAGIGGALMGGDTGGPVAAPATTTTAPDPTSVGAPDTTVVTTTIPTTTQATTTTTTTTTTIPTTTTTTVPTTMQARTTTTTIPTTITTTIVDARPPIFGQDATAPTRIWELDAASSGCPTSYPRASTIAIDVTDADSGVDTVTASWTIGGAPGGATMTASGSTYTTLFGPFPYQTVPQGEAVPISITITARDLAGNESTAATTITVGSAELCAG